MSLFIEFHLIQNFAPSNLNRDDTGAPKDAIFGGYRRARVSSQCFKRSIRVQEFPKYLPLESLAVRTKKLIAQVVEILVAEQIDKEKATLAVTNAVTNVGSSKTMGVDKEGKTDYLVLIGHAEIAAFANVVRNHLDQLAVAKAKVDKNLKNQLEAALDGKQAVDIALFGRMLANLPEANQDAACQVAHALSTHRVEREFDYFTAVDDKGDPDETGAGMIGQVEFNSATFYRYAVIDAHKLVKNLQEDKELALTGIRSFVQAMARAIPTGKQNTFAAHNPPSFVGVVLRHSSPFNLANAFEKPVWPKQDRELTALSVERLAEKDDKVSEVYGDGKDEWAYLDLSGAWPEKKGANQRNLDALADWVVRRARAELEG